MCFFARYDMQLVAMYCYDIISVPDSACFPTMTEKGALELNSLSLLVILFSNLTEYRPKALHAGGN